MGVFFFAQAYTLHFLKLFELAHDPCIIKLTTPPVGLLNPTTLNLAVSTTTIYNNQCLFIVHASHELAGFSCLSTTTPHMFLSLTNFKVHGYVPLNFLCMRYNAATTVFLNSVKIKYQKKFYTFSQTSPHFAVMPNSWLYFTTHKMLNSAK